MDTDYGPVRTWIQGMYAQGYSPEAIAAQLVQEGWSPADIAALLGGGTTPPPAASPYPGAQPPTLGYAQASYPPAQPSSPPTDGQALAALILGIATLIFGPLTGVAALVLGTMALKRGGPGRPLALAGVIISGSLLCVWLIATGIFIGTHASHPTSAPAVQTPPPAATAAPAGSPAAPPAAPPAVSEQPAAAPAAPDQPAATPAAPPPSAGAPTDQEETTCISNVKQLAAGMRMYAADNDDTLPYACFWIVAVMPYVTNKETWMCPNDDRDGHQSLAGRETSYAMFDPSNRANLKTLGAAASGAWLLFDGSDLTTEGDYVAYRHLGAHDVWGLNMAYADGHAQWMSRTDFENHPK
jgi:prepilin-type processing-associated H-X9-DG protein